MFTLLSSKQTRFLYLICNLKLIILINFTAAVDSGLLLTKCGNIAYKTEFVLSLVPININITFSVWISLFRNRKKTPELHKTKLIIFCKTKYNGCVTPTVQSRNRQQRSYVRVKVIQKQ